MQNMTIIYVISLVLLFFLLGKTAEILVKSVKILSNDWGVPLIFSGFILGFFTSMPEFFIGIISSLRNINEISYGNLLGGIIVLFGLVSGLSIILNKEIKITHNYNWKKFLLIIIFLHLPILAAFIGFGKISALEGFLIVLAFLVLLIFLFKGEKIKSTFRIKFFRHHGRIIFKIILSLTVVIVLSRFIVDLAIKIIEHYNWPVFLTGLIIFSIGTNLPEIIVTIDSWRQKVKELSLGNIIGSAVANSLIIGLISFLNPIFVQINLSFIIFTIFFSVICILYAVLALTDKKFNLREGLALLSVYIIFIITQIFIK